MDEYLPKRWTGVETSASFAMVRQNENSRSYVFSELLDINGDGKPDRILEGLGGDQEWYVQLNNGSGFDQAVKWNGIIQLLPHYTSSANYAIRARNDQGDKDIQELVSDLVDLDGDGLPDRVLRPSNAPY